MTMREEHIGPSVGVKVVGTFLCALDVVQPVLKTATVCFKRLQPSAL